MSNENIVHVEAIENLLSEANKQLAMIVTTNFKEKTAKDQLFEEIDLIQKDTLYTLRVLFEGD